MFLQASDGAAEIHSTLPCHCLLMTLHTKWLLKRCLPPLHPPLLRSPSPMNVDSHLLPGTFSLHLLTSKHTHGTWQASHTNTFVISPEEGPHSIYSAAVLMRSNKGGVGVGVCLWSSTQHFFFSLQEIILFAFKEGCSNIWIPLYDNRPVTSPQCRIYCNIFFKKDNMWKVGFN